MSDWQPQIVKIAKVEKHPGADALDVATVLNDYPVIVKRDEYKVGDLAAYIPIDTIVPDTQEYHFMCPVKTEKYEEEGKVKSRSAGPKYPVGSVPEKCRIIKAKQIRGAYSQGMLVPCPPGLKEGESVVDALKLTKWEEVEEEHIPNIRAGATETGPAEIKVPHYDVVAVRRFVECLHEGEEVILTEKLHGSNAAFVHDGTRLWVKSRNFFKAKDPDDMWWDVAIRCDIENKLRESPRMVFFGEVYGQVKNFRYDTTFRGKESGSALPAMLTRVRFFDVLDAAAGRFLDYDDKARLLEARGLDAVPLLYRGPWLGRDAMYALAEGPTTLGGQHVREGWVLNTAKERVEPALGGRMQVKLVGEGYNLQK